MRSNGEKALSTIKIFYLGATGLYRQAKGKIDLDFPTLIRNRKDGMRHLVSEHPVFHRIRKPMVLATFQELVSHVPPEPQVSNKQIMICEDNSYYPVAPGGTIDWERRLFERKAMSLQATQYARGKASRTNDRFQTLGMGSMVIAGAVALLTVVFAFVALGTYLDQREGNSDAPKSHILGGQDSFGSSAPHPLAPVHLSQTPMASTKVVGPLESPAPKG